MNQDTSDAIHHAILAFNPESAEEYEFADFFRCCVYRTAMRIGEPLQKGSIVVLYRTGRNSLIGEFEVVRVERIDEPTDNISEDLYAKAFAYPVTLYDGQYHGPYHIFFHKLRIYSPDVSLDDFRNEYAEPNGINLANLSRPIWLDERAVFDIRGRTCRVSPSAIETDWFIEPLV